MTVVAIHQPQYLPYLGFFHKVFHADLWIALDDVQYEARGIQNRNKIKNAHGWQWLTVPVLQKRDQRINEVRMNPSVRWTGQHWKALETCYGQAPYFKALGPGIKEVLDQDHAGLCDLNMAFLEWAMGILGIDRPAYYSSRLDVSGQQTERLVHLCQSTGAKSYLSGPGGRRYMDLEAFAAAGITVLWQEFEPPVYEQRFPEVGFIPNLSIVDVLFNCGPASAEFLR